MDVITRPEAVIERTQWGAWLARTPADHRFRLAALRPTAREAEQALGEAVAAWDLLAQDGDDA